MPMYDAESVIGVDSFRAQRDGYIRASRLENPRPVEVGQNVGIVCDDRMQFARVVRIDGDRVNGSIWLKRLTGRESTRAARELAERWDDGCDVLDDEY